MYNDRLIPSVLLHDINLLLAEKNWLIEKSIKGDSPIQPGFLSSKITQNNYKIDSLFSIYDKTYIVETEAEHLKNLKRFIAEYKSQEIQILKYIESGQIPVAVNLYDQSAQSTYIKMSQNISYLMSIQVKVGSDLLNDVDSIVSGTKLYSTLQIGLAILIGLLIMGILFTMKSASTPPQKDFHLN